MITTEQRTLRKNSLGGSDAAAALGVSRWRTPLQLFLEKTEDGLFDREPETDGPAYWGNVLEPVVAAEFSKRTGLAVQIESKQITHPEYSFLTANLDRVVTGKKELVECKTTMPWNEKFWQDDEIPMEYLIQCMHYLALTGFERAHIAVLLGTKELRIKVIERDDALIKKLIAAEVNFWENFVIKKVPPMIDGSEASKDILKMLYPIAGGETISLPAEFNDELARREALRTQIDVLELEKDTIENKIKMFVGENAGAVNPAWSVKWPTVGRTDIDSKRLKAEAPDLWEKFKRESSYRKLNIKKGN